MHKLVLTFVLLLSSTCGWSSVGRLGLGSCANYPELLEVPSLLPQLWYVQLLPSGADLGYIERREGVKD